MYKNLFGIWYLTIRNALGDDFCKISVNKYYGSIIIFYAF